MTTNVNLTIGELAGAAGVNVETIRYYEREGILPEPPRASSGYRQYSDADVWRLAFIRRGKEVGFTLKEIGELLGAGDDRSVAEVRRIAEKRLALLDRELADLAHSRDRLQRLIQTCASGSGTDCVDLAPSA